MTRLFFGAGGGADILAALAYARSVMSSDEWEVAGWLSPVHDHFFSLPDGGHGYEVAVNSVSPFVRFKREATDGTRPIHGLAEWSALASPRPSAIDDLWRSADSDRMTLLSLAAGTAPAVEFFSRFSTVTVVDVGGDILFDGSQAAVRTPVLDAMALGCVSRCSDVARELVVVGPGLDGELTGDDLSTILSGGSVKITDVDERLAVELLRASRLLPERHSGKSLRGLCDRLVLAPWGVRDPRDPVVESLSRTVLAADFDEISRCNPLTGFDSAVSAYRSWEEIRGRGSAFR